jgi:hypothetical protein
VVEDSKVLFIKWLINRLLYKHNYRESDVIILSLNEILKYLQPKTYLIDLEENDLDKIISKYYADFNLDATDDINIGYTPQQRENLRNQIKHLVSDIVNKNIPQDFTIKDK